MARCKLVPVRCRLIDACYIGVVLPRGMHAMAIVGPSTAELAKIAADLGFHFDDADVAAFREMMRGALDAYAALDRLPDALPQPRFGRLPGSVPAADDNPFGAFARIAEITWRVERSARRQASRRQGLRLRRRRADDERLRPVRRLRTGNRRDRRDAHSRCRWHYRRQGRQRRLLLLRRQPYQCRVALSTTRTAQASPPAARLPDRRRWSAGGIVDMAIGTDQGGSIRSRHRAAAWSG